MVRHQTPDDDVEIVDDDSADGDYLESFCHSSKNAEDSDGSDSDVVEVGERPPTHRASSNGWTVKKRAAKTELSNLVLLQPPPHSRKPGDLLLMSYFTSENI